MTRLNLMIDEWDGRSNIGNTVSDVSQIDVMNAFARMDGKKVDSLLIEIDDEHFLGVGSGLDGQFVLSIVEGTITHNLVGNRTDGGETMLKVGGQKVAYLNSRLVSRDDARSALEWYLFNRLPNPDLVWERKNY